MGELGQATELPWVPARLRELVGARVHGVGTVGADRRAEMMLQDGPRVRATPAEALSVKLM